MRPGEGSLSCLATLNAHGCQRLPLQQDADYKGDMRKDSASGYPGVIAWERVALFEVSSMIPATFTERFPLCPSGSAWDICTTGLDQKQSRWLPNLTNFGVRSICLKLEEGSEMNEMNKSQKLTFGQGALPPVSFAVQEGGSVGRCFS